MHIKYTQLFYTETKKILERIKMNYIGHGWGIGFGMWLILILFGALVFYFVKENNKSGDKHASAQDILDMRYAKGEIDTQEYEEKSNALKK